MIKDIKYRGITTAPSDYESPDGAMSVSLNLISEDQHLTPIFQPKPEVQLQAGCNVVGIHRTAQYAHYIIRNDNNTEMSWLDQSPGALPQTIGRLANFRAVESVGNTLLLLSENSINYFLWKDNTYTSLGDHLPNVEISFGLKGKPRFYSMSDDSKSAFRITFDNLSSI